MKMLSFLSLLLWMPISLTFAQYEYFIGNSETFSFTQLQDLVKSQQPKGIEELLKGLPEGFRKNFIIITESHSRQFATSEEPRVLLFSSDAKLLLTFNGTGPGNEEAEIISFDEQVKAFKFHKAVIKESKVQIVEAPKHECMSCHGHDLRPNWMPYPFWPGTIGERHNRPILEKEERTFRGLRDSYEKHPRYSQLIGLKEVSVSKMVERNLGFTQVLAQINFDRVARLIKATPDYEDYKYLILKSLRCSGNAQGLFQKIFTSRNIPIHEWNMQFRSDGNGSYDDPFVTPSSFHMELSQALGDVDKDLAPFVYDDSISVEGRRIPLVMDDRCDELTQKNKIKIQPIVRSSSSLPAIIDVVNRQKIGVTQGEGLIKNKCMICHTDFSNQVYLKTLDQRIMRRTDPSNKVGFRMPLNGPALTEEERSFLKTYLDSL